MTESGGKHYLLALLGVSDLKEDGWMATDTAMTVALTSDVMKPEIYSFQDFRDFACCSPTGFFKYGEDSLNHIEVPAPKDVIVVRNSVDLKNTFLEALARITTAMNAKDTLLIFIAARDCGDIIIGSDTLLSKHELKEGVKTRSQRLFFWSTSCYRDFWLDDVPWSGVNAIGNEADRTSNNQTTSSLPSPHPTRSMLQHFRLVPYTELIQSPSSTPPSTRSGNQPSAAMREVMNAHTFEWPSEVDLDELVDLATPFMDCELPKSANLQRIQRNLLLKDSSPEKVRVLWSIFKHRQQLQQAIETFLMYGPWGQTRAPDWNQVMNGHAILRLFIIEYEEAYWELCELYCWECDIDDELWPPLSWPDIKVQLALAWDTAGRPSFSTKDFPSIVSRVEKLKEEKIRTHSSYQAFVNWSVLQSTVDDPTP